MSLDGLRVEVPTGSRDPVQVTARVERFAQALASGRFSDWGVRIERLEAGALRLAGRRDQHRFEGEVRPETDRVVVLIAGQIELGRLKLTLAGGPEGVRRRVHEEIGRTLREHLST